MTMSRTAKWNPVPNPWSEWTPQENFAYRLHKILHHAFWAGARYGAENPSVFPPMPRAQSLAELSELPDFVSEEFELWAARHSYAFEGFGLSPDVVADYFAGRP